MASFHWFDPSNISPLAVWQILVRVAHANLNTLDLQGESALQVLLPQLPQPQQLYVYSHVLGKINLLITLRWT